MADDSLSVRLAAREWDILCSAISGLSNILSKTPHLDFNEKQELIEAISARLDATAAKIGERMAEEGGAR